MKRNFSRIAATLYLDNNYLISRSEITYKYVESAFLINNNTPLSIEELIDEIYNNHYVHISEVEVQNAITANCESFICANYASGEESYYLRDHIYKHKQSKNGEFTLNKYIEEYHLKFKIQLSCEETKNLVWRFVYELFANRLSGFSYLVNGTIDLSHFLVDEQTEYTDEQREIINGFLNYDEPQKNKAIFDIACYALEYCLFTSNTDTQHLTGDFFSSKHFYLDTNIVYRALGINGDRRRIKTLSFLSRCKDAGQKLFITANTRDEYLASIQAHCHSLSYHDGKRVNPGLYKLAKEDGDFDGYYYQWAVNKENRSLSIFQSEMQARLVALMSEFDITLDNKAYQVDASFTKAKEEMKSHLLTSTGKDGFSAEHDSYDLSVITHLRDGYMKNVLDTKYFYISTDWTLKRWDEENTFRHYAPRVVIPDHWLTLLARFSNHKDEDYNSFISFINLSTGKPIIDSHKFTRIIAGISEITEDFAVQREILVRMMDEGFRSFISISGNEIKKLSSAISKNYIDEKLSGYDKTIKEQDQKIHSIQGTVDDLSKGLLSRDTIVAKQNEENSILRQKIRKYETNRANTTRYFVIICCFVGLLLNAYLILCTLHIVPTKINLLAFLIKLASDDFSQGIVAGVVIGTVVSTPFIISWIYRSIKKIKESVLD